MDILYGIDNPLFMDLKKDHKCKSTVFFRNTRSSFVYFIFISAELLTHKFTVMLLKPWNTVEDIAPKIIIITLSDDSAIFVQH